MRRSTASFWISGASHFLRLITQIAILGWGAYLALDGQLTGGMMIAASIIAGRALQPLEGMIEGWRSVVQTRAAYARVRAAVETLQKEKPRLRLPKPQGRLTVDKLLYLPPGTKEPVLNGVSFELQPGESLAIVGPSGSGKSTLARILVGCLLPTAGKVRLDGTELRNWDRRQFGEYTGYLPQEVELFPGTIKENVCRMRARPARRHDLQRRRALRRARHDLPAAERLRDRAGAQRRAAVGRPEAAHRAGARLLRRAGAGRARRAQLQSRRRRRAGADRDAHARQGRRA